VRGSARAVAVIVAASVVAAAACLYGVKPLACDCIPAPPSDWQGPFWISSGGAQSCPTGAPALVAYEVGDGGCGPPSTCTVVDAGCNDNGTAIEAWTDSGSCSGPPTPYAVGSGGCTGTIKGFLQDGSIKLVRPVVGTFEITSAPPSFAALGCGTTSPTCDDGKTCLSKRPSGFDVGPCVSHAGSTSCADVTGYSNPFGTLAAAPSCVWSCDPSAYEVTPSSCPAMLDAITFDASTCLTIPPNDDAQAGVCYAVPAFPQSFNARITGFDAGVDASCTLVDASTCTPPKSPPVVTICCASP
jgi:hypothetical protein